MTSESQPPILRMDAVTKRYGVATALDNVDLNISAGCIVAIQGANGSGKSTLLRIAATLTSPSEGQVLVNGVDANRRAADARRHIGAVMHSPMLYSELTVRENLSLFATLCQLESPEKRVDEVSSRLHLQSRMDERVGRLSHGFRKRVAIARAIIHSPLLLLLDEPETGLDDNSLEVLMNIIAEWKSQHRSVLIATHSADFVTAAADIAYAIDAGQLQKAPTP